MKKILLLLSALLLFSAAGTRAQSISLDVLDPLPEVNFGDFASWSIKSMSQKVQDIHYFTVTLRDITGPVVMEGNILWKDFNKTNFQELFYFKTRPFNPRNNEIRNEEIGKTHIRIEKDQTQSDVINENLRRGKPVGTYRLEIRISKPNGELLGQDSKEMVFINIAPSITITSPFDDQSVNVDETLNIQWSEMPGASKYTVRVAEKKNNQGLEDALRAPNPIVNDRSAGISTNLSLTRNMFDRDWRAGQEIVVQVTAYESGSATRTVKSAPVRFTVNDPSGKVSGGPNNKENLQRQELEELKNSLQSIPGGESLTGLINDYINGNISSLVIKDENGRTLSMEEIRQLLLFLSANPDLLVNIKKP